MKAIRLLKKQKRPSWQKGIDYWDFKRAGSALKKYYRDREFVEEAIKTSPEVYKKIDFKLKSDKKITIRVVRQSGSHLAYAPKEMKADREVVLNAFNDKSLDALEFMDTKFKSDAELVLSGLRNVRSDRMPGGDEGEIWFWTYVDKKLQQNKSFVLEAMKCGSAYQLFDIEVVKDPQIRKARQVAEQETWKRLR